MKVTFILTDFPAYSQTFVLQQIKNLIDSGHQVKILANNNPGQNFVQPIFDQYNLSNMTLYYKDNIYDSSSPLTDLRSSLDLDSDIFHCHFMPTGLAITKIAHNLSINKPIIITGYGVDIMAISKKGIYSELNKPNIYFVAVSDAIKQKMIYLGIKPEKIWIIPLTVNTQHFKYAKKNNDPKSRFISVCRLVEKKGLDSAIKAFNAIKKNDPNIDFTYNIYGDGPEYDNLNRLISNYNLKNEIRMHPPIDHKYITKLFKKADYLIQTSKTALNGDGEGLPTVILEAQSSGLPIIGTYHSGIPEEVINDKTGFLSDEKDIKGIADSLYRAIRMEKKDYLKMSRDSRSLMEDKFDDRKIHKLMINLYEQIKLKKLITNQDTIKETKESSLSRIPKSIKVLFFNHTAGLGGSERSLLELIDELQDLGVICKVIVPYYGDLCRELEKRAVEYQIIEYHWWCSLDKKPKEQQVSAMNSSVASLMTHKSSLDAWGPDVIFTNTLTIPWGGVYSQLANKPHMTFIREFGDIDFNFDFFYGFKGSLDFINEYSDYIFTNSKATLNHFKNYIDRTKSDYAYAYINIDKKLISSKTKSLFKKKKSLKLAIMGAIIPSKGQEETVRAAVSLIRKGLDIELAIIGSKHDQSFIDKLNSIIKSGSSMTRIKFYDFVVNPYNLMRQCDAIIVASSNEAYGRVAIEAMSMGKPVIGTNSGATKEIVINDEAGLLYTPGNHQELAEKIEFLYNNRNKAKELGKKAQRRYKKIFNKNIYGMKVFNKLKKINNNRAEKGAMAKLMNDFSSSLYDQLQKKDLEIEGLKKFQAQIIKERDDYNMKLGAIYSSKTWKVLYFYKKIINSIRVFQGKFKK